MPINRQYHTWFKRIRELRPKQRITQVRNFVWLLVGIHKIRSVTLSHIAGKIPGQAKLLTQFVVWGGSWGTHRSGFEAGMPRLPDNGW